MIYIIEDNPQIREVVAEYLKLKDHEVLEFARTEGVLDALLRRPPDLCILDVMLPDGNGFALAKHIRTSIPDVPFIFLTAKDTESDRILGLEIGADDYISKPFSPRELVLRVEAVLRRTGKTGTVRNARKIKDETWTCSGASLVINEQAHIARVDNQEIRLTGVEWKILLYLASQPGVLVSRERILGECLEYIFSGSERIVDTHIKNIRHKLGKDEWIETVRGFGYRFAGVKKQEAGK
ncbi:MAG: response regulator transcription factor [Termitinemataceae bacterium]